MLIGEQWRRSWSDLPAELKHQIALNLETRDLKNLRLTDHSSCGIATSLLFHTLHISPSTVSYQCLENLSNCLHIVDHVRQIVCHGAGVSKKLVNLKVFKEELGSRASLRYNKPASEVCLAKLYEAYVKQVASQQEWSRSQLYKKHCLDAFRGVTSIIYNGKCGITGLWKLTYESLDASVCTHFLPLAEKTTLTPQMLFAQTSRLRPTSLSLTSLDRYDLNFLAAENSLTLNEALKCDERIPALEKVENLTITFGFVAMDVWDGYDLDETVEHLKPLTTIHRHFDKVAHLTLGFERDGMVYGRRAPLIRRTICSLLVEGRLCGGYPLMTHLQLRNMIMKTDEVLVFASGAVENLTLDSVVTLRKPTGKDLGLHERAIDSLAKQLDKRIRLELLHSEEL